MNDLIERLRAHPWAAHDNLRREAADEIEHMQKVIDRVALIRTDLEAVIDAARGLIGQLNRALGGEEPR